MDIEVVAVRRCLRCLVRKPVTSFRLRWGERGQVCNRCAWWDRPAQTPGMVGHARRLVITERGHAALREMAA